MSFSIRNRIVGMVAAVACLAFSVLASPASAQQVAASELKARTHIHGLAVDRTDPDFLLIATHHGLFRAGPDGEATLISEVQDFMGFTPDPSDPAWLFASGHPAHGGNLGFIASTDNGATWTQVAPGVNGPVDVHQMTVSPADPKVIYGAHGGLQVSRDAGKTWSVVGSLPDRLIDLAASAEDANTLYAATEKGLSVSRDGGATWKAAIEGPPVSLVEATSDGALYAFVLGQGLVRSSKGSSDFETLSSDWGDAILLHLAVDPADPSRIFVASHHGDIQASTDGGKTWQTFGG